jgi:hypothetical protein
MPSTPGRSMKRGSHRRALRSRHVSLRASTRTTFGRAVVDESSIPPWSIRGCRETRAKLFAKRVHHRRSRACSAHSGQRPLHRRLRGGSVVAGLRPARLQCGEWCSWSCACGGRRRVHWTARSAGARCERPQGASFVIEDVAHCRAESRSLRTHRPGAARLSWRRAPRRVLWRPATCVQRPISVPELPCGAHG